MMLCEMLLSAGLVAAAACDQPKESAADAASATLLPPAMAGESYLVETPEGENTGMTLADVAFNAKWRKATFDEMISGEE